MKKCFIIFAVILFSFCHYTAFAQLPADQRKAIVLKRMIELRHYSPRPVDDSFSLSVFRMAIHAADPKRLLFTESEYRQLSAHNASLDDELHGKGWAFLALFSKLYRQALQRADSIVGVMTQKPFDFSVNDTIFFTKEKHYNFAADVKALTGRWTRYLKYQALFEIFNTGDSHQNKKAMHADSESSAREKLRQAEQKSLRKILNPPGGFPAYVQELYFNCIASAFDPHTNYFSPEEKEKFQSAISTEAFSFGLELEENHKGQVVIKRMVPGGPAWKSGELHKGDELLGLQWEGKTEEDMAGATLEEIEDMLEESVHGRLGLKFRKADGTEKTVMLRKEKIENEENIVKGFVLRGDKKIGYILLPGFYTEWENESGSRCANDVAKEIVKLKKENIDGLILDVRFNGGGSLGEAMELAGIFINEGPLTAVKMKNEKLTTLKDPNRGTIYDGPLILMVNGQSASASEILAATLQDYNRAVIVGSNTYGKATMQQMFSPDTLSKKAAPAPGKEMIKITTGKLFRITGESVQQQGVVPEVELPDAFDWIDYREKFSPHALSADTVKRNAYFSPLPSLPVKELAMKSAGRIAGDTAFQNIIKFTETLNKVWRDDIRFVPLKWENFEKWKKQRDEAFQPGDENPATGSKLFAVENHQADKLWMQSNEYAREVNTGWLRNIGEDIYIREAYSVVCDLINLHKHTAKN
jgi:carboxyl-terminal processing protease